MLIASKNTLLKPLQTVMGVVKHNKTMPILANVLIESAGDRTALVATDLELEITTWVPEATAYDTALTVSAKKLLDICRALPDGETIALDLDDGRLRIRAGKSHFSLQTLPAQNFPRMQLANPAAAAASAETGATDASSAPSDCVRLTLPQEQMRHLLARVQYAMAVQDIRHYLNGLLVSLQGDRLVAVATNGHRLALDAINLPDACEQDVDVILPRRTVQTLIKLLDNSETPLDVQLMRNQVMFATSEFELRSKVVNGKFPDYQRVIPSGYDKSFVIEQQRLRQALARMAILTSEKYPGVRLVLEAGSLRLSCINVEREEALEELEIDYQQAPLEAGFNVQYLQDVLDNLDAETVQCSFRDSGSAVLITVPGEAHFRYVVMPMRL